MFFFVFFFQAEDGIRDRNVTGVQTCALPISEAPQTGWSVRRNSLGLKSFAELTTPSAALRRLRAFLLMPQPPLLFKRSEERRVGKSVYLGGRRIIEKKKKKD